MHFSISQSGIVETAKATLTANCQNFGIVSPKTNPAGVNIRNRITKSVIIEEYVIKLLENGLDLNTERVVRILYE